MPAMVSASCLGIDTHAHQHDHRAGHIGDGAERGGQGAGLADRGQAPCPSVISTRAPSGKAASGASGAVPTMPITAVEASNRAGASGKRGLDAVQHGASEGARDG
jgi:hypothetical protein